MKEIKTAAGVRAEIKAIEKRLNDLFNQMGRIGMNGHFTRGGVDKAMRELWSARREVCRENNLDPNG